MLDSCAGLHRLWPLTSPLFQRQRQSDRCLSPTSPPFVQRHSSPLSGTSWWRWSLCLRSVSFTASPSAGMFLLERCSAALVVPEQDKNKLFSLKGICLKCIRHRWQRHWKVFSNERRDRRLTDLLRWLLWDFSNFVLLIKKGGATTTSSAGFYPVPPLLLASFLLCTKQLNFSIVYFIPRLCPSMPLFKVHLLPCVPLASSAAPRPSTSSSRKKDLLGKKKLFVLPMMPPCISI